MKQEEKDLLLKDLCARLPYGVVCHYQTVVPMAGKVKSYDKLRNISFLMDRPCFQFGSNRDIFDFGNIKPYLFPLSSMTDEQMEELKELCDMYTPDDDYHPYAYIGIEVLYKHVLDDKYKFNFKTDVIDWFNKNHFDYHNLIERNLAIDATDLNIY